MRFPPSFIERLRQHFLMSDVIGKRIALKQFGREYKACCPFHQEKTPSFTVNNEKGFFHCFGCGAHGDAIEFVRRYDRLSYPEAIEQLAREGGLPLPELNPQDEKKAREEKTLFDVLEATTAWYEQQLAATHGTVARDYLEKRGIKPETIRQFRIGYAPNEPRLLYQHLKRAGFNDTLQEEAGLISVRDKDTVFDRFRGRVIFPIRNGRGKVVAFGGRLLQAGATPNLPKYLNSPETPLFKKGEMLFNLDLAKAPAREHGMVVVMEGYTDVVSAWQAGVTYSVATLGTAVTSDHLRLLWQLAKEPVICLDGDEAGKRAMRKAVDMAMPLLVPGKSLRFALLPSGEDPDSYIGKHGKQGFERILASSGRLSQTIWDTFKSGYSLNLPEGRAALEDALKQLCDQITNPTVRQHYLSYFRTQLWERTSGGKQTAAAQRSARIQQMVTQSRLNVLDNLARNMLQLLLHFPSFLESDNRDEFIARLDIMDIRLQAVRNAMLAATEEVGVDNREAFLSYIKSQVPDDLINPLLKEKPSKKADTLTEEVALRHWKETKHAHEIAHLEYELEQLQESLGSSMNEDSLKRLIELQNQIKTAQSRRHVPVEELDIA